MGHLKSQAQIPASLSGESTQIKPHWAQKQPAQSGTAGKGQRGQWEQGPQSLQEMQLNRQFRLHTQAALPAGRRREVKRAAAMGKDCQWASDLISYLGLLFTELHFLY